MEIQIPHGVVEQVGGLVLWLQDQWRYIEKRHRFVTTAFLEIYSIVGLDLDVCSLNPFQANLVDGQDIVRIELQTKHSFDIRFHLFNEDLLICIVTDCVGEQSQTVDFITIDIHPGTVFSFKLQTKIYETIAVVNAISDETHIPSSQKIACRPLVDDGIFQIQEQSTAHDFGSMRTRMKSNKPVSKLVMG